jgi:capsule polysaccharide export protein KpsC/LpsZ
VKDKRDGLIGKSSEILALERSITKLPDHVQVMLPETATSTWSLLSAADYCLTVRGTVGIEAALLGKVVLTAGTGRYDRHGFTHDYDTREDYLEALSSIESLDLPEENSQELASRFASGIFLRRPIRTDSFQLFYVQDEFATLKTKLGVSTLEQLRAASDLAAIVRWLHSGEEDFLEVD